MAADVERGVLDRALDSGGVAPDGGAVDRTTGLIAFASPRGNGNGSAVRLVWLGHVSFGIYLWHFQVMRVLVLALARTVEHALDEPAGVGH